MWLAFPARQEITVSAELKSSGGGDAALFARARTSSSSSNSSSTCDSSGSPSPSLTIETESPLQAQRSPSAAEPDYKAQHSSPTLQDVQPNIVRALITRFPSTFFFHQATRPVCMRSVYIANCSSISFLTYLYSLSYLSSLSPLPLSLPVCMILTLLVQA